MNESLLRIVRTVRRRWRLRLVVRGLAISLSAGLVAFLLSAYGMDKFRFTPAAVVFFRVVLWGSLVALAIRYLWQPLRRRVTDEQVALYIEEHEPSLDGQVLSAVGLAGHPSHVSPALIEKVVERAVQRCHAIDDGRRIEHAGLMKSGGWLAGAMTTGVIVLLLNPAFIQHSGRFLLSPWSATAADNPYSITVNPGDSLVARGADLRVTAQLINFDADDVELVMRPLAGTEWERWPMTVDEETGGYLALLFDVSDTTEYFVEAAGVRTPVFRIDVADLPYVDQIALEYHFPRYTGLSVLREEDGGDIAALVGTRVQLDITPTLPVAAGALVVNRDTVPLEVTADGSLAGELVVRDNGSYRVLLSAPDGALLPASKEYFIDALDDLPPIVSLTKPGRDVRVSSIDELFLEARAEDDYGVRGLELIVSVNGGSEDTIPLYGGHGNRKQVTAAHTLYLEELDLEPGDVITYYARATDARRTGAPSVTDIYFASIRPFDQTWRQAEQGGQGGEGAQVGELSERQRQIVAGTFNLVRDSASYSDEDLRNNLATLVLAQGRLREDVETLVRRLRTRGVAQMDSTMATIAEELPLAAQGMSDAEERLGERAPREALPPEQQALQHLQRAESVFRERQLAQDQQGPGGGGQGTVSDELAELFELELDRMRNQYEQVERGERRDTDQQIDEMLEKLRELARRQQQENERSRARAQRGTPSGGTSQGQRRLAGEAEELARRLERLSRERSREDLAEISRRLEEAANAMRRAAAQGRAGNATGNRALDRLREARRRLEQSRSAGLQRDVEDARQRAERLAQQQRDVRRNLQRLSEDPNKRREQLRRLVERKEEMAAEVTSIEAQLEELSRDARQQGQDEAAGRLRDAAGEIRDRRLRDKIRYSEGVVQQRNREYTRNFEESIQADIDDLEQRLGDAVGSIGESREQGLGRALDEMRDVAQALESMRERMQEDQEDRGERQFRRELRERVGELRDVREQFRRDGIDVSQLDDVLRAMRRWDNSRDPGDPRGLATLENQIIQGLRDFEFALRRALLGTDDERATLSGSDEVPAEYRQMVEEYYRKLAERRR